MADGDVGRGPGGPPHYRWWGVETSEDGGSGGFIDFDLGFTGEVGHVLVEFTAGVEFGYQGAVVFQGAAAAEFHGGG